MRQIWTTLLLASAVGCSTSRLRDDRLIGTWRSNSEQTVAKMFEHDPRWTNAPPERVQKLRAMFGTMTITYGNGTVETRYNGENQTLGYRVVQRGEDYVIIRIKGGIEDGQKERLRFVDGNKAYWIHSFMAPNIEERFDRVADSGDPAHQSQAAGSAR